MNALRSITSLMGGLALVIILYTLSVVVKNEREARERCEAKGGEVKKDTLGPFRCVTSVTSYIM